MNEQDIDMFAAMESMAKPEDTVTETVTRPVVSTRRTKIVADIPGEYSVRVSGYGERMVRANNSGDAVLLALDEATRESLANYGAAIFLWQYDVTDPEGNSIPGEDKGMRDALQAARIRAQ